MLHEEKRFDAFGAEYAIRGDVDWLAAGEFFCADFRLI